MWYNQSDLIFRGNGIHMQLTLSDFLGQLAASPALIVTSILTMAVILVNGWTDAPNAIATCVSTRAMRPGPSIIMAAIFNLAWAC